MDNMRNKNYTVFFCNTFYNAPHLVNKTVLRFFIAHIKFVISELNYAIVFRYWALVFSIETNIKTRIWNLLSKDTCFFM